MTRIGFIVSLLAFSTQALAVSSQFTFQGSLEDGGAPANGSYDLQFVVKNTGGSSLTPVLTIEDVSIVGGVFTVTLDFGDAVFNSADRRLGVSVRPGPSSAAFVPLLPDLPINATPYSLTTNSALTADIANDVVDLAINSVDIANLAVTTAKIQNDAVTADKLASNSVGLASLIGASSSGLISVTISANDCTEANVTAGGVATGDFVLINTSNLPDDIIMTAVNAPATNTLRIKICNVSAASQTLTDVTLRYISIR